VVFGLDEIMPEVARIFELIYVEVFPFKRNIQQFTPEKEDLELTGKCFKLPHY
jgi:hypothetical protein